MNHQKIQEMLLILDAPGLPTEKRREVMAHSQGCEDCQGLLTRWERIHVMFANVQMATASRGIADKVIERLVNLEACTREPTAAFRPLVQWLYPTLGYVFALLLMFTAIVHWEPFLNTRPNTEEVLLSSIPQGEQLFFTKEPPEINRLFVTQ